jgi:iron(III) transport system ATP-binding protein
VSAGSGIELRAVSKRYGGTAVVDRVSLTVEAGALVTLLGPSGCGKTTTLRLIAGLETPDEGEILIEGRDVTTWSPPERNVSLVFQSYALFPHLTVLDNVAYGPRARGVRADEARRRACAALALVGLTGLETRLPSQLSGGQQQRVALARALAREPGALLFDEPLSNLDARLRRRVRDEIRALQRRLGLSAVYVTHDREEALAVSDRIIVMDRGRIVEQGTPAELFAAPRTRFVADFLAEANIVDGHVRAVLGELAEVVIAGHLIRVPHRGHAIGPVAVAVRPDAIAVQQLDGPDAASNRIDAAVGHAPAGLDGIPGTVVRVSFVGRVVEYAIETAAGEFLAMAPGIESVLTPGARVSISLSPRGVVLVD